MDGARQAERRPRGVPGHADCIPGNGVRGEPAAPGPLGRACRVSRWHGHHAGKIDSIDCHLVILTWSGGAGGGRFGGKNSRGSRGKLSVGHGCNLSKYLEAISKTWVKR